MIDAHDDALRMYLAACRRRGVLGISEISAAMRGMREGVVTLGLLPIMDLDECSGVKRLLIAGPISFNKNKRMNTKAATPQETM